MTTRLYPVPRPPAVSRLTHVYLWVTYSAGSWRAELSADTRGEHVLFSVPGFGTQADANSHALAWAKKRALEVR